MIKHKNTTVNGINIHENTLYKELLVESTSCDKNLFYVNKSTGNHLQV